MYRHVVLSSFTQRDTFKNISTPSCFGWIFVFKNSWQTYRAKRRDAWRRNVFPSNSSIEFPLATVKPPWYLFSPPVAVGTAFKFTVFHFIHFGDFLIVKKRKLFSHNFIRRRFFFTGIVDHLSRSPHKNQSVCHFSCEIIKLLFCYIFQLKLRNVKGKNSPSPIISVIEKLQSASYFIYLQALWRK